MPGLRQSWYPWPYQEGMTIAEAGNELSFIATGLYGKKLPPQNGGPIRLVLPWKYGFKGTKSITRIVFTDQRPKSFWERIQSQEYGFWANVNPEVPHPRWSQASERLLGSNERVPTKLYNGYGEFVASLYADMPASEKLFM
jgi:sulfoxide reductase catalytic subunit YedY